MVQMPHNLQEYAIPQELTRKSLQFEVVTKKEAYRIVYATGPRYCKGPAYKDLDGKVMNNDVIRGGALVVDYDKMYRAFCGYDINKLILRYDMDGILRAVPCPKCQVMTHFAPPLLNIVD